MICYTTYASPLGELTLAACEDALVGLWLPGQKYYGGNLTGGWHRDDTHPVFDRVKHWLAQYFAGIQPRSLDISLRPQGTSFQQTVWHMLQAIPYGEVTTYGALSRAVAAQLDRCSMSAQAIGNAVGRNPISILVPCHRVVGANGSLTGYAGGIDKKRRLLALEGVDTSRLHLPKQ